MDRAKTVLCEADHEALLQAVQTLTFLTQELQAKGASLERLRRMLFGSPTEKTSQVLDNATSAGGDGSKVGEGSQGKDVARPKAPGHGRNGASAYRGAEKIRVPHGKLKSRKARTEGNVKDAARCRKWTGMSELGCLASGASKYRKSGLSRHAAGLRAFRRGLLQQRASDGLACANAPWSRSPSSGAGSEG